MRSRHDMHIDPILLLFASEDALPEDQAALIRRHLEECCDCQARKAEAEAIVEDLRQARRRLLDPQVPTGHESRARFLAGLSQMVGNRQQSWVARIFQGFDRFRKPAFLTTSVAFVTLIAFVRFALFTPVVSAHELLARASSAERSHPITERRLRVRLAEKEFHRRFAHGAWDVSEHSNEARAREIFVAARLDWTDPLSAERFAGWHDHLRQPRDTIARSKGEVTLRTFPTDEAPVREASLTVAENTWRPVAETVLLRDGRSIEVSEMELAPEPVAEAGNESERQSTTPHIAVNPAAIPIGGRTNATELADAEVFARVALHRARADSGGEVEFTVMPGDTIAVRTTVESVERRKDLQVALQGVPHIRAEIQVIGETPVAVPREQIHSGTPVLQVGVPALQDELRERFRNEDERAEFVGSVLTESQSASTEAWELRRLVERYSDQELARISTQAQYALEGLLREHVDALAGAAMRTENLLKSLTAPPVTRENRSVVDWREWLSNLSGEALALRVDLMEGLSRSPENRDGSVIRASIENHLKRLEAILALRRVELDGHFLGASPP
jgi:hypothetical protein